MRYAFAFLVAGSLLMAACASSPNTPPQDVVRADPSDAQMPELGTSDAPAPQDIVSGVGTIRYVDLEGGFYGLVANDSTRYTPTNLDAEFQEDGLEVRFRGELQDVMTMQMWGKPLEILDITRTLTEEDGE
ncbi:MAG: hypothetical protein ACR2GR_10310 [Rhodothermales bacterium]